MSFTLILHDMIDLNNDNDPLLFSIELPKGRLICQYMEIVATVQAIAPSNAEPDISVIIKAIRQASRSPEVTEASENAHLVAAWYRMTKAMESAGKD